MKIGAGSTPRRKTHMRTARIKLTGRTACYHVVSRTVGGAHLLRDLEKERLVGILLKLAAFCGMDVITYCMMSNHFHILIRVPELPQLTDAQLLERVEGYYGRRGALTQLVRQAMAELHTGAFIKHR